MKAFLSAVIFLAVGAIAGVIAYAMYSSTPEGKILVSESFIDSLKKIAAMPPDTFIKVDTFYQKAPISANTTPIPTDTTKKVYEYKDSLKTKDLAVYLTDSITRKGRIVFRNWQYRLFVPLTITKEIRIEKPVPLPYEVEKKVYFKYYGQIGYNFIQGGVIGEVGIIRSRFMIGAEGGKNFAAVKIGVLF